MNHTTPFNDNNQTTPHPSQNPGTSKCDLAPSVETARNTMTTHQIDSWYKGLTAVAQATLSSNDIQALRDLYDTRRPAPRPRNASGGDAELVAATCDNLRDVGTPSTRDTNTKRQSHPVASSELSARVSELLRDRHRLRTSAVLALLSEKLNDSTSFSPKISLKRGVEKLARTHGESAVLSAAHQVASQRNRNAHPDWSLKDRTATR